MTVLVVGGNVNLTMNRWLRQLGIFYFEHVSTRINSITPDDLALHADRICHNMITINTVVISVGPIAHKILSLRHVDHGVLPATSTKDEVRILRSIKNCREYLIQRRYYEHPTSFGPR